ncbi:hypothetical protein AcV5_006898 [Taiwanofungus camphoratus]|nr:hypothetical protein AcV5_006898 [Antrodia cinnamomea]
MAAASPPDSRTAPLMPEAGEQATDDAEPAHQPDEQGPARAASSASLRTAHRAAQAGSQQVNNTHVTQDGAPAAGDHSLSSDISVQAPSPSSSTPQPFSPAGLGPATMATTLTPVEKQQAEAEKVDEKGAGTATTFTMPLGKRRRREGKEVSEGIHTASSTTERPSSRGTRASSKRARKSLFARIAVVCTSCISSSRREHEIDVDEGASRTLEGEKHARTETETSQQHTQESSTSLTVTPPPLHPIVDPGSTADPEILIPPTPSRLLPRSETHGLTAGAVQPPGSTGHDVTFEHGHAHTPDSADESDSSFTEEEVFRDLMRMDEEDEEQILIRKGGIGIPIGLDGTLQPLLPPVAPEHLGRKCLVLDLDETLVHSSLKAVPSPDYIVPVEIESFWHNFYVLKRPGVDGFLKRMGEIYEVVVFTASLSKYADPVLDRLDPDGSVAHRLFRENCYNHRGNYVKDLSQLGRPIGDTIIIDNSPASYIFHPHNAVPISSWFNDPHDTELTDLCPFLTDLGMMPGDVRGILNSSV